MKKSSGKELEKSGSSRATKKKERKGKKDKKVGREREKKATGHIGYRKKFWQNELREIVTAIVDCRWTPWQGMKGKRELVSIKDQ